MIKLPYISLLLTFTLLLLPALAHGDCSYIAEQNDGKSSHAIPLKLAAIISILFAGGFGVCIPSMGRWVPAISPDKNIFLAIKAFAAGVILATGFIHILPDAFQNLTSPCLKPWPWENFPFAGFVAMVMGIGTFIVETSATGYFSRAHEGKVEQLPDEESCSPDKVNGGHTHVSHGHTHGHGIDAKLTAEDGKELIRRRIISQVLEMGIVVHSVIIGISLGASENASSIRPLVVALSFHQFFEGMGLGGCLVKAQFKARKTITMIIFFSFTTPVGIAIGIGISSVYNENSPTALIVEGILNSGAAGILIYMAFVDLLAADFMNSKIQSNANIQIMVNFALLLGAALMSLLAIWS